MSKITAALNPPRRVLLGPGPSDVPARVLAASPKTKVLGIVHAETSTGAHQPLQEIFRLVHEALRLVEEEGFDRRIERHARNHRALPAGIIARFSSAGR